VTGNDGFSLLFSLFPSCSYDNGLPSKLALKQSRFDFFFLGVVASTALSLAVCDVISGVVTLGSRLSRTFHVHSRAAERAEGFGPELHGCCWFSADDVRNITTKYGELVESGTWQRRQHRQRYDETKIICKVEACEGTAVHNETKRNSGANAYFMRNVCRIVATKRGICFFASRLTEMRESAIKMEALFWSTTTPCFFSIISISNACLPCQFHFGLGINTLVTIITLPLTTSVALRSKRWPFSLSSLNKAHSDRAEGVAFKCSVVGFYWTSPCNAPKPIFTT